MIVMKFGGASVKDAASVRNVTEIILHYQDTPTIVVISAMDKTTNALEKLLNLAEIGEREAVVAQFETIRDFHIGIVKELFGKEFGKFAAILHPYFEEMQQVIEGVLLLGEYPPLMYDRIVAYGELLSTQIVAAYIRWIKGECTWLDARQYLKTDMQYGQAKVLWSLTEKNVIADIQPLLQEGKSIVTQGFIASTIAGKTTTLGREGSDFTAAILAYCLKAEQVIIWKDVRGVLNSDPRLNPNAQKLSHLSYEQAVQMTFYGATVIHPKTIQPLYIRKIPLYVKSFKDITQVGTCISAEANTEKTPIYIQKENQAMLSFTSKDFGFMDAELVQVVLQRLQYVGAKINACQNTTLDFIACIDNNPTILNEIQSELGEKFDISIKQKLTLFTTIYYSAADLAAIASACLVQIVGNTLCVLR